MKSILFISHDSELYGAPRSLLNIVDGLKHEYNFITLVPKNGALIDELHKIGIKTYISRFRCDVVVLKNIYDYFLLIPRLFFHYIFFIKTLFLIIRLHKLYHFDYIHSNSGVIRIGYWASRLLKIRHIWHVREFQFEYPSIKILYGKRYLVKLFNSSDVTIPVSHSIKDYFKLTNANLIYNGVMKLSKVQFSPKVKEDFLLYASSISQPKGIFDAIELFSIIAKINNTITLYICGTGTAECLKSVNQMILTYGLQNRVLLLGFRNDIPELMSKAKALLMLSKDEPFGRVTVEAMFMGCPVIGYNNAGTREIISSNKYGFLCDSKEEVVKSILCVLKCDVNEIIKSAYERACSCFSQDVLCIKVKHVYDSKSFLRKDFHS